MKKEFLKKISQELKKAEKNQPAADELTLLNSNEAGLVLGGEQNPTCPKLDEGGCNPYGQCTVDCFINIGKKSKKNKKAKP